MEINRYTKSKFSDKIIVRPILNTDGAKRDRRSRVRKITKLNLTPVHIEIGVTKGALIDVEA